MKHLTASATASAPASSVASAMPPRIDSLDALRGAAMVWMAVFHFCFDLNHFGLYTPRQSFYFDSFWTLQRTCIVSLFLFTAGLSLAVALQAGQSWPKFWRRWAQVAGCAVLVSVGSAFMFPKSWISFGVLHGIAVMLLLARCSARRSSWWLFAVGAAAITLPHLVRLPLFDHPWLNWVGLFTRKPITEDHVPLLPWLGVVLWGLALGRWVLTHHPRWLAMAIPRALAPLASLGRWSLSFYMLHQPVLIGVLMLYMALR